jgi:hypothetical protein
MNSRPIKIRFRVSHALICAAILLQGRLVGDNPPAASYTFPSKQQVVAFLVDTIDWYRRISVEQQIATEPADILFLQENRTVSAQVVRFSFDFGKAAVAFEVASPVPADPKGQLNSASSSQLQHLVEMEAKSASEVQRAGNDLKSLEQKRKAASRADRNKLEIEIADTQSRLKLLQAISASSRNLLDFIRATDAGRTDTTDLDALIDGLERTVPEASSNLSGPLPIVPAQSVSSPSVLKRAPSGILGRISDVLTLARKGRTLDDAIGRTDKLVQSAEHLQRPLSVPLNEAFRGSNLLAGTFASNDIGALRQQEARLNAFTVETTTILPAIAALSKQRVLLSLYKSRLTDWRTLTASQYRTAWKTLIISLAALGAVIALLIGAAEASRGVTSRHVHDPNSRRMILTGQRVLFWLGLVLIVAFAFAFDLSSVATFLGLVSAGVAVALQNVILAVIGYFLLVGKLRIRVGDHVQISGVSGEVVDIGLMQFQLKELDTASEQPTGRVVSFSNSFVFVSPATGLFRRIHRSATTPA